MLKLKIAEWPYYDEGKKEIGFPLVILAPAILAHEIAHALENNKRKRKGKMGKFQLEVVSWVQARKWLTSTEEWNLDVKADVKKCLYQYRPCFKFDPFGIRRKRIDSMIESVIQ